MKSDGQCTAVACKDGSIRLLASLENAGFAQVGLDLMVLINALVRRWYKGRAFHGGDGVIDW